MRAFPRLLPVTVLLTLVVTTMSVISGAPAAIAVSTHYPTGVTGGTIDADGRLADPELADCDVPRPAHQFITFPSYAQTAAQICGIWSLEDAAASAYAELHGYTESDPWTTDGLYVQAGYVQNFLQVLSYAMSTGPTDFTADQTAAYGWFLAIQQKYEQTVAADAQQEYDDWSQQLCSYRPPNPTIFTYNPTVQSLCTPDDNPTLASLLTTLAPPTYANFVEYGRYDAEQELGLTQQASDRADEVLIDNGIVMGSGSLAAILAGGAPQLAADLGLGEEALVSVLRTIAPKNVAYKETATFFTESVSQDLNAVNVIEEVAELEALGEEIPAELEAAAEVLVDEVAVEADVAEAGLSAVEVGADFLTGPMIIATIAITIAVTQGVSVFTAANIPHQLAADVAAADPSNTNGFVMNMLTADKGAKAGIVFANYRSQLQFPEPTVGVKTSEDCSDCVVYDDLPASADNVPSRLHITALNPDGTPSGWSTTAPIATFIDTWGLGSAAGAAGVPHVSVGIAGGRVWTKRESSSAPTDESEAGLSGWLPHGELHYFNATGQPMIAYLQGDQFVTETSPGSVDVGGADAGDDCATVGECTSGSSIVVMGSGGTPQLRDVITAGSFAGIPCSANTPGSHDCFTDTLKANGRLVPATGSTITTSDGDTIKQSGTSHLYRLTILPDTGTPAAVWVTNSYNTWANNKPNGVAPNGGLVAGDTATFSAPETSAAGYDTTYTWHVQTVCPVDPEDAPQTIQGVTVCSDSPDYGQPHLAGDEQDLSSCVPLIGTCTPDAHLGVIWTPDPAFHGGPVATLHGQVVDWTWAAPGTYHLRLITTDQYGVSKISDRDLVVSAAAAPRSSVAFVSAADPQPRSIAPSVIGPVKNGNALTVTGCVVSPTTRDATAYSTPDVSVDWGDGDSSGGVLAYQPSSGCTTPWQWTATHTYAVPTLGQPFVQVPITVSTRDVTFPVTHSADLPPSTQASSTVTLYANIYAPTAPPSFVAGASTSYDFTAGEPRTVSGYVTSAPTAAITKADATGVTHEGATCTSGLPSGMGFQASDDNHFVISGTPRVDAGGCYAITVTATNPYGSTDEKVVVDVERAPQITSGASAGWATSDAHDSVTVTTTGFPNPTITVTDVDCTTGCGSAFPPGVTFVDNGDGTATLSADGLSDGDTGVYEITLEAASASGTDTQMFTLTIEGLPVFTSADSTGFTTGQAGTFDIGVSSTTTPTITCTVSGSDNDHCLSGDGTRPFIDPDLPNGTGLSLVGSAITGVPAAAGSYPVTLTATNAVGSTTQHLTILVSTSGGATITMVPGGNLVTYAANPQPASGSATFIVGQAGTVTVCSNVPGDRLSTRTVSDGHQVTTPLPAGLAITAVSRTTCPSDTEQFTLGGTPTTPLTKGSTGSTAYRIVDSAGGLALLTLRLVGDPTFSSPPRATFTRGETGSFTAALGTLRFTSGTYFAGTITKTGELPAGLTLTTNGDGTATIVGTPTTSGRTTVTLTGANGSASTQQTLTIDVVQAPTVTSSTTAGYQVGAGGTFTVTTNVDAYPAPVLGVVGLPRGVTFLDNGDGTGTLRVSAAFPATTSPVRLSVEASSSSGSDTQELQLVIGVAPVITSPAADATVVMTRGSAAAYDVESSGVPIATLTADDLPAGLDLTDNGDGTATLSGTPTALGESEVTVSAVNGIGSAATRKLDVQVVDAAAFAGTTDASCSAASAATKHHLFVATTDDAWTVCGTGSPTPVITAQSVTCGGETTNLPSGLTFTDNEDGSATIGGSAAIGSGAACPDGYTVSVAFANAGGTVVQDLALDVQEVIEWTTPTTTAAFVPGAPNTAVLGAAGSPAPAFALDPAATLPAWLTLTDQGNGTATLSGTPPLSAAGGFVSFRVRATNAGATPLVEEITVPVSTIGLTAAALPPADLGVAYDHQLEASSGVSFDIADGSALPSGMTLSASGLLSGTPTELGRFPVALTLTDGGTTVTTGTFDLKVGVGADALEISQFRTIAPGDWFVQVVNTTAATIPLAGWRVGLQQPGSTSPELVPIGTGTIAPGATAVVTTTAFSLRSQLEVTAFAAPVVPIESGFEIVAPNGVVTDAAGVAGALPTLVEGDGVEYPSMFTQAHLRYAFVRNGFPDGHPVDTDDNAADFTYTPVAGVTVTSLTVSVSASALTATVAPVAPGTGVPTGRVDFQVDGVGVGHAELVHGVATLTHRVPTGSVHVITAAYDGSAGFAASSGSVTRRDPVITAHITSAKPKSRAGWYRRPVTVTFTCTTAGARLSAVCPRPATLRHDGAKQTVARTVTAVDGGRASITVSPISVDRTAPSVRIRGVRSGATYHGKAPRATCVAHDALSGVARCTVTHTIHGRRVFYTALATDRAGNRTTTLVQVRLASR